MKEEGRAGGKQEGRKKQEERREGRKEGEKGRRDGGKDSQPLTASTHKDVSVYLPSPRLVCLLTESTEKVTHRLFSPTSVNAFYLHRQGRQHQQTRYTRLGLHTQRRGVRGQRKNGIREGS